MMKNITFAASAKTAYCFSDRKGGYEALFLNPNVFVNGQGWWYRHFANISPDFQIPLHSGQLCYHGVVAC